MTVADISDWVELLSLLFASANFVTLFVLVYEIRTTVKWHRINSRYSFIDTDLTPRLEQAMLDALARHDIDLYQRGFRPLRSAEIDRIWTDREATLRLNHFINDLQNLCTARRRRIVDARVFGVIHLKRVQWWYQLLHPYVAAMRTALRDPDLWADFVAIGKAGGHAGPDDDDPARMAPEAGSAEVREAV